MTTFNFRGLPDCFVRMIRFFVLNEGKPSFNGNSPILLVRVRTKAFIILISDSDLEIAAISRKPSFYCFFMFAPKIMAQLLFGRSAQYFLKYVLNCFSSFQTKYQEFQMTVEVISNYIKLLQFLIYL